MPLFAAGAEVEAIYPVIPISDGHALAIGRRSSCGDWGPRVAQRHPLPAAAVSVSGGLSLGSRPYTNTCSII